MSDQFDLPLFKNNPVTDNAEIVRTFLGWEHPLLTLAVEHLTREWTDRTLDLSNKVVVVPTRQAGRRLRSSLALHASTRNTAVLPPSVVTPDFLLSANCLPALERAAATRAEVTAAWTDALLSVHLNDFRHVFPIDPGERSLSWALSTADDLIGVQNLLGDAGLTMQSAATEMAAEGLESQRWGELSRLEQITRHFFSSRHRMDPQEIRLQAAKEGVLPPEVDTIIIIGVPDPPPLFCRALRHHGNKLRCEVVIHAPDSLAESFDEFGRPRTDHWLERSIEIPNLQKNVHQAIDPQAQAEHVTTLVGTRDDLSAVAAIGVPDPELLLPLKEAFAAREQATFNPAGEKVSTQALATLLRTLHRLTVSDSFLLFLDLLRIPGVARQACDWQAREDRPAFDPADMLTALDTFQRKHLPDSLEVADHINRNGKHPNPALSRALSWIQSWLRRFERERIWEVLPEFLSHLYAETAFDPADSFDEAFASTTQLLHDILDSFEAGLLQDLECASSFPNRLRFLLHLLEQESIYQERKPEALDLQGWLELPWEDAPHLVVTGLNDGFVPESLKGHAYLPDGARRILGLRHNETRHARDAYILSSLLACRSDAGRQIDLLFGRRSGNGDPLRPSRLLFACPPEELAVRVQAFFQEEPTPRESPAWSLTWQLTPPPPDDSMRIFARLPVTGFRDYLSCPFRFYLRRGLNMELDEGPPVELDARNFGTLCHEVVEEFAAHPVRDSDHHEEIAEFFEDTLDTIVTRKYGEDLPVPILVQRESVRQRLKWWASIEADQRKQGWQIQDYESDLDSEDAPWIVNGIRITGKIDRIERQSSDESLRVLDFKTGRLKTPRAAHLRNLRGNEDPSQLPPWMMVSGGKRMQRWIDLQLPLYLLALRARGGQEPMAAGYVTLGRAKSEVALELWEDLDEDLLTAAMNCAEGVIDSITARRFWPPAERMDWDDFETILLGDPGRAIDPVNLLPPQNAVLP
ncbi:MAG: PD-(D/E)XK nuclease family protein [Roseibacillus sp.]|nr:PD-(D/E)XK nuclease family protein [Roseibacillus sp.]